MPDPQLNLNVLLASLERKAQRQRKALEDTERQIAALEQVTKTKK